MSDIDKKINISSVNGVGNTAYTDEESLPELQTEREYTPKKVDGVTITWKNLVATATEKTGFRKTKEKEIIRNISGIVQPGELVAIMGSSGAGKTTFLNILANQGISSLNVSGKILVNGVNYGSDIIKFSAYVQQQDMFYGALTVRQHLLFHANLRDIKNPDIRVQEVINEMGLQDCADNKIGNPGRGKTISGGERKRLSFATEILQQPPLLFCDEPTSGLDSYLANQVTQSLRKIAASGTTVLCTIHQPSSDTFSLFDNLILLAKGECAFIGTTKQALNYFQNNLSEPCPSNYNPSDHFINVLSIDPANPEETKKIVSNACKIYNESKFYDETEMLINKNQNLNKNDNDLKKVLEFKQPGYAKQIYWLFWRALIINYKDPLGLLIKAVQVIVLGIIFGLIYLRVPAEPYIGAIQSCDADGQPTGGLPITQTPDIININGALFIMLTNSSFTYVFFVVTVFPMLLPIWRIENGKGLYSVTVAYIATNLSELPTLIVLPFVFTSICYWMFGLVPAFTNYILCYLILELICQVAISFGYMVSTFTGNLVLVNAIAAPLLIPLMIFGGFFIQANSIPVYLEWLKYLSWFYYGNGALLNMQWDGMEFSCQTCDGQVLSYDQCGDFTPSLQNTGENILTAAGFDQYSIWFCIGILAALMVGYRSVSYFILLFKFRDSQR